MALKNERCEIIK